MDQCSSKSPWRAEAIPGRAGQQTVLGHRHHRRVVRLNQLLREYGFDDFVEAQCAGFYAKTMGRPSLPPSIYVRLLLIGYFEGIDSERGIARRAADSLALLDFLGLGLADAPPDHSTIPGPGG